MKAGHNVRLKGQLDFCLSSARIAKGDIHSLQLRWKSRHNRNVYLAAQSIVHHIGLARLVVDGEIIVLDQFEPSPLPEIQLFLSKDVLETFVISIYVTSLTIKMMSPDF